MRTRGIEETKKPCLWRARLAAVRFLGWWGLRAYKFKANSVRLSRTESNGKTNDFIWTFSRNDDDISAQGFRMCANRFRIKTKRGPRRKETPNIRVKPVVCPLYSLRTNDAGKIHPLFLFNFSQNSLLPTPPIDRPESTSAVILQTVLPRGSNTLSKSYYMPTSGTRRHRNTVKA